jgi:hypothetical protein
VIALACELPAEQGLPLSRWSSQELAREAVAPGSSSRSPMERTAHDLMEVDHRQLVRTIRADTCGPFLTTWEPQLEALKRIDEKRYRLDRTQ